MTEEISEAELLAQYKAGHDGLSYKVAWLENQLDWVQKILAEIDKKCGSGFLPWEIEDAYAEYQRLIDVGPDNARDEGRNVPLDQPVLPN